MLNRKLSIQQMLNECLLNEPWTNDWGREWPEHLQSCKVNTGRRYRSKCCCDAHLHPFTSDVPSVYVCMHTPTPTRVHTRTHTAFLKQEATSGNPSLFRKSTWLCYLQIVRSCHSWLFWHSQKPPEWGLLVEAAFPAHPKIHSHLVIGESDAGTDSSALDGCCHKTLPLIHRSSPILLTCPLWDPTANV